MTLELLSAGAGDLHPPCPHLHQQLELSGESWHSKHFQTSLLCPIPWQCCGFVPPGGPGQEPAMNFSCSRKVQLRMWQQLWGA